MSNKQSEFQKLHTVLLPERNRPEKIERASENFLPIQEIIEQADGRAYIVLADKSVKQIIRFDPQNGLTVESSELEQNFRSLLEKATFDLQFLVTSERHPVAHGLQKSGHRLLERNSAYTKWLGHYLKRWSTRVCELTFLSQRKFYIVAGTGCGITCDFTAAKRNADLVEDWLHQCSLSPRFLTKPDIHHLFYKLTNPSNREWEEAKQEAVDISTNPRRTQPPSNTPEPSNSPSFEAVNWLDKFYVHHRDRKKSNEYQQLYQLTNQSAENQDATAENREHTEASLKIPQPVDVQETTSNLSLSGHKIRTMYLSQLPEIGFGWPICLELFHAPYLASIHIKHGSKIAGTDDSTKIASMYVSLQSGNETSLNLDAKKLSKHFKLPSNELIFRDANTWQFESWIASLPLGIDPANAVLNLKAQTASTFFLPFGGSIGDETGVLLGYTTTASTPTYIDISKSNTRDILIVGDNADDRAYVTSLLTTRHLPLDARIAIWDFRGDLKWLIKTLGNRLVSNWSPAWSWVSNWNEILYCKGSTCLKNRVRVLSKFIDKAIDDASDGRRKMLFVSECAEVLSALPETTKQLLRNFKMSECHSLVMSTDPKIFQEDASMAMLFNTKLLTGEISRETGKLLQLPERCIAGSNFRWEQAVPTLWLESNKLDSLQVVASGVEYYWVQPGMDKKWSDQLDIQLRENFHLNLTDLFRMASYRLGTSHT